MSALTNPLVVRLVNVLVDTGVVLKSMDPVNHEIIPDHEEHRRDAHPCPAIVIHAGVEQALAAHLGQEKRQGHDVDPRDGGHGRHDLLANLVLEEARVVLQTAVENEVVREGAEHPVQERSTNLGDQQDGSALSKDVVPWPCRLVQT